MCDNDNCTCQVMTTGERVRLMEIAMAQFSGDDQKLTMGKIITRYKKMYDTIKHYDGEKKD